MSENMELSLSNFDMNKDIKNIKHLCFELMHKPLPIECRSPVKWSPGLLDMELFDIIIQIFSTYTLGVKELVGVRQIIKNKYGNQYVNKFNKLLSSKSLLWRDPYVYKELDICLRKRSSKFIMLVKKENKMFYLCKPDKIPEGFYVWNSKY
jgi:hypothetical protein